MGKQTYSMEHLTYPQLMFVLRGRHRSHYAKDNTWPFKSSLLMKKEISKKYIVSLGILDHNIFNSEYSGPGHIRFFLFKCEFKLRMKF